MLKEFLELLQKEKQILTELVSITEKQNHALIEYKTTLIPEIVSKQDIFLAN